VTCGFTLIEVLVALVVVAAALAAATRLAGLSADHATRLSQLTAAQWCADNELAQMTLAGGAPTIGTRTFRCEQLQWSLLGLTTVSATAVPQLRRIVAEVRDQDGQLVLAVSTAMAVR
jgi:general secretion pathway protein I